MTGKTTPVVLMVLFAGAALLLAGCVKEVKLTAGGEKVEFVENPEGIRDKLKDSEQCKLVVTLKVTAQGSPEILGDKMEKEAKDRLIRARNLAAKEGTNVLIAVSEVEDRTQSFEAYKCK